MSESKSTILAVGAAGRVAGLVVPALAARGAHVRGLIRTASQAQDVLSHGAAEIAIGDLRDRASLDAALRGVDSVFYIAPAFLPDEVAIGKTMVAAAMAAGVRRFVFSAVIQPEIGALGNHIDKIPVMDAILESGMEYCFLNPTMFFQNIVPAWPKIVETGIVAEPWAIGTVFSRVDYRDVAEAAAIALTEDRLLYGTFELCAEGWLDRREVAALIGEVLGRKIEAARSDPDMVAGAIADKDVAAGRRRMFGWYDRFGLKGSALPLRAILGREPRTLRAFFEELAGKRQASE